MQLKLKAIPDDFVVEEVARLPLVEKGGYGVYLLKKRGWNTVDLLHELSRTLRVGFNRFAYGGKKDRYGSTCQYVSIHGSQKFEARQQSYSLQFAGWMRRPMGPDLIEKNLFKVAVRGLAEPDIKKAASSIEALVRIGYPNYFDDQRFGSFDARQGFFAEKVLKGQYNGATKIYLTSVYAGCKKGEKQKRGFFFEHWQDWDACLAKVETKFEKTAFDYLSQHPKGYLEVLKKISREELSTFVSAYQSYLWNEMLRGIITSVFPGPLSSYQGVAGDYIFYTHAKEDEFSHLVRLRLAMPGSKPTMTESVSNDAYRQVV